MLWSRLLSEKSLINLAVAYTSFRPISPCTVECHQHSVMHFSSRSLLPAARGRWPDLQASPDTWAKFDLSDLLHSVVEVKRASCAQARGCNTMANTTQTNSLLTSGRLVGISKPPNLSPKASILPSSAARQLGASILPLPCVISPLAA